MGGKNINNVKDIIVVGIMMVEILKLIGLINVGDVLIVIGNLILIGFVEVRFILLVSGVLIYGGIVQVNNVINVIGNINMIVDINSKCVYFGYIQFIGCIILDEYVQINGIVVFGVVCLFNGFIGWLSVGDMLFC